MQNTHRIKEWPCAPQHPWRLGGKKKTKKNKPHATTRPFRRLYTVSAPLLMWAWSKGVGRATRPMAWRVQGRGALRYRRSRSWRAGGEQREHKANRQPGRRAGRQARRARRETASSRGSAALFFFCWGGGRRREGVLITNIHTHVCTVLGGARQAIAQERLLAF